MNKVSGSTTVKFFFFFSFLLLFSFPFFFPVAHLVCNLLTDVFGREFESRYLGFFFSHTK